MYNCHRCGAALQAGMRFCGQCGLQFEQPVPAAPSESTPRWGNGGEAGVSAQSIITPAIDANVMGRARFVWLKAVIATSVAALVGGKIFSDQIGDRASQTVDVGAWLTFIVTAIAIYRISRNGLQSDAFRKLWICCAIAWPLFISIGYFGTLSLAKRSLLGNFDEQRYQQQFRDEYGRDATPQEIDQLRDQASAAIDQGLGGSDTGSREKSAVMLQWLYGPFWVSAICIGVNVIRSRRRVVSKI